MESQHDWRYCIHCKSLFFAGAPDKGHCPASASGHSAIGFNFGLSHDISAVEEISIAFPGSPIKVQRNWRYCSKCHALFYDGFPDKGVCPTDLGPHSAQGFDFVLGHGIMPEIHLTYDVVSVKVNGSGFTPNNAVDVAIWFKNLYASGQPRLTAQSTERVNTDVNGVFTYSTPINDLGDTKFIDAAGTDVVTGTSAEDRYEIPV